MPHFFVKVGLVAGGALLAAVAETVEIAHAIGEVSGWTVAGLVGAGIVCLGAIFIAVSETNASKAIEEARQAVESARVLERQADNFEFIEAHLNSEVRRGLELYNSMDVMRGAIEQSLSLPKRAADVIQICLSAAVNSLVIAFDFDISDNWTICVFQAVGEEEGSDKVKLECVAHARKIDCPIGEAREWPEGVGVAGVAYSMRNEVVIADMAAPQLETVFKLKSDQMRPGDSERYRSMVAVPIMAGPAEKPWGIAVVTTAAAHHFDTKPVDGVSTSEPIRAIAAMAALAVRAVEVTESSGGHGADLVSKTSA